MSIDVGELELVGVSAVLSTVSKYQMGEKDLLSHCGGYSLRGGSVPWRKSLQRATDFKFIQRQKDLFVLTSTGQWLAAMIDQYMEPSPRFLAAFHVLFVSRSSQRGLFGRVEIEGASITDTGGFATQALRAFVDVGALGANTSGFMLQGGELDPLLVGLMMMRPGGTAEKKMVGDIGEGLTLLWLRANGWDAVRVSEVADEFGFDLLATKNATGKAVECKASAAQSGPFRGFLTRHELSVASKLKDRYELLVWGQVNVAETVAQNYARLITLGFPRIINSPWEWLKLHAPAFVDGHSTAHGHEVRADGIILGVP